MMKHNIEIKLFFVFTIISFLGVSCSCSDKECKSTQECETGFVCRNGDCVENSITTPTDSDSDDDTESGQNGSDSNSDSDTATTAQGTDSESDTTDSDSQDTSVDTSTGWGDCAEDWECDDGNACTTKSCSGGTCAYAQTVPAPVGCCTGDTQCDDSDDCTADSCITASFSCQHTFTVSENCCLADTDCNDGNSCTLDSCTTTQTCLHIADLATAECCADENDCGSSSCSIISCQDNSCVYDFPATLATGCCVTADDCPPGEGACTVASCNDKGECEYETNASAAIGCCMTDAECDDGNDCNVDVCAYTFTCVYSDPVMPAAGCCVDDGDCSDSDNCTADICSDNICQNTLHSSSNMPAGCCAVDADCDDWVDCTADTCFMGRCISQGDPAQGVGCCYTDTDCNDGNACTTDVCDSWNSECSNLAPSVGSLPVGCCLADADCTDSDDACNIGVCGPTPQYTCAYNTAADDTPCENGSWCDGPEVCSSGSCVTRTADIPCNGPLGICRLGSCDDLSQQCTVAAEYDTDVSCDDGLFCNGVDLCSAGDCTHFDAPCIAPDTDTSMSSCEELSCDEAGETCVVDFKTDYTPCENGLACDGANLCVAGICEPSGDYCGGGSDCLYYICDEDTDAGLPTCTMVYADNGTPCTTPDMGLCFGTTGRMCLNGECTIGTDPMCTYTGDGFDNKYYCKPEWGTGWYPAGGCGYQSMNASDTDNFKTIGCPVDTDAPADTDTIPAPPNTAIFSTALAQDLVNDYGGTCGSGFIGGDAIYQIAATAGQTISVTLSEGYPLFDTDSNLETTNGGDVYVMILTDAGTPSSCVAAGIGTAEYTVATDGSYYIVVDMQDQAYATGRMTVDCF